MSETLTDLLAKVEAGTLTLDVNENFQFSRHWNDEDWHNLLVAYRGSLDAAKALHKSLIHEAAQVSAYYSVRYEEESRVLIEHNRIGWIGTATNPARAWLIAILKALIAKDQTND